MMIDRIILGDCNKVEAVALKLFLVSDLITFFLDGVLILYEYEWFITCWNNWEFYI